MAIVVLLAGPAEVVGAGVVAEEIDTGNGCAETTCGCDWQETTRGRISGIEPMLSLRSPNNMAKESDVTPGEWHVFRVKVHRYPSSCQHREMSH
jgi:hypothetical protein